MEAPLVRRELLHQAIQDRIKLFIIEHGFRPGDPLPAEAEMARALGISRPSLREAMKALQMLGVIETKHGSGSFVGRFSLNPLIDGLAFTIRLNLGHNLQTVKELLEVRMVLESALVPRVASARTTNQIATLRALVAEMEEHAARDESVPDVDLAFHDALYRPLGNTLVVTLLRAFWEVIALVRDELPFVPVPLTTTVADHRRIVAAIEAGDGFAAAAAMTAHFDGIQRRLREPSAAPPAGDATAFVAAYGLST